jgi:hypothetical protein
MLLCSMPVFCFIYLMLSIAYIYHFSIMLRRSNFAAPTPLQTPSKLRACLDGEPGTGAGNRMIRRQTQCSKMNVGGGYGKGLRSAPGLGWTPPTRYVLT